MHAILFTTSDKLCEDTEECVFSYLFVCLFIVGMSFCQETLLAYNKLRKLPRHKLLFIWEHSPLGTTGSSEAMSLLSLSSSAKLLQKYSLASQMLGVNCPCSRDGRI
jgi:hypothetical protein